MRRWSLVLALAVGSGCLGKPGFTGGNGSGSGSADAAIDAPPAHCSAPIPAGMHIRNTIAVGNIERGDADDIAIWGRDLADGGKPRAFSIAGGPGMQLDCYANQLTFPDANDASIEPVEVEIAALDGTNYQDLVLLGRRDTLGNNDDEYILRFFERTENTDIVTAVNTILLPFVTYCQGCPDYNDGDYSFWGNSIDTPSPVYATVWGNNAPGASYFGDLFVGGLHEPFADIRLETIHSSGQLIPQLDTMTALNINNPQDVISYRSNNTFDSLLVVTQESVIELRHLDDATDPGGIVSFHKETPVPLNDQAPRFVRWGARYQGVHDLWGATIADNDLDIIVASAGAAGDPATIVVRKLDTQPRMELRDLGLGELDDDTTLDLVELVDAAGARKVRVYRRLEPAGSTMNYMGVALEYTVPAAYTMLAVGSFTGESTHDQIVLFSQDVAKPGELGICLHVVQNSCIVPCGQPSC